SAVAERVRYAAVKSGRGRARQCTSQDTVFALKVEDVAPNGFAIDRCFAFDRMVESWRFPGNQTTCACPRKPAGATWLARHSDTLQPNTARNHREKALRAENPSSSATDASGRSRFST